MDFVGKVESLKDDWKYIVTSGMKDIPDQKLAILLKPLPHTNQRGIHGTVNKITGPCECMMAEVPTMDIYVVPSVCISRRPTRDLQGNRRFFLPFGSKKCANQSTTGTNGAALGIHVPRSAPELRIRPVALALCSLDLNAICFELTDALAHLPG